MEQIIQFTTETPSEILGILQANSDFETDMQYIEPLSKEEKQAEDLLLSDKTQEVFDKEEEIKRALEPLKNELKNLREQQAEIRSVLKVGGYAKQGNVFVFMTDDNRAQIYSETGRLLEVRPLTISERQLKIKIV